MVVVLLTGMSGTGKSTALAELARRGYETVDTDDPGWIERVDGEPRWSAERIDALLARPRTRPLFLLGTVVNQGDWASRFDAVVLLTAPIRVLLDRLRTRASTEFGGSEADRAQVVRDVAETEPRLRRIATDVVDGSMSISEVVARLEAIAQRVGGACG